VCIDRKTIFLLLRKCYEYTYCHFIIKKGSEMEFCVCIDRKTLMIDTNTTMRF